MSVSRSWKCDGKRRFKDHEQASRVLRQLRENSKRTSVPIRAYECNICRGWHLTSKAK